MDHYDLDYEMAIAFRAEVVRRLFRRLEKDREIATRFEWRDSKRKPNPPASIPEQNTEQDDDEGS